MTWVVNLKNVSAPKICSTKLLHTNVKSSNLNYFNVSEFSLKKTYSLDGNILQFIADFFDGSLINLVLPSGGFQLKKGEFPVSDYCAWIDYLAANGWGVWLIDYWWEVKSTYYTDVLSVQAAVYILLSEINNLKNFQSHIFLLHHYA